VSAGKNIVARVAALAGFALITATTYYGFAKPACDKWSAGRASLQWVPVDARLMGDDPFKAASTARADTTPTYTDPTTFALVYEFTDASGRVVRGERYSFRYDERAVDVRGRLRQAARRVREADDSESLHVVAYYDPQDPNRSCLERGSRFMWFPIAMSGTFMALAIRALVFAVKNV
jgi:hypothetical protein